MEYSWAEIGGVRLDGAPTTFPYRGIALSRLTGWRGLPGMRGGLDMIPGAHGAFVTESMLRDPRSMELKGFIEAGSVHEAAMELERIEVACAVSPLLLRVQDESGVWSRLVEAEAITPVEPSNRKRIVFSIDLVAPDPRRYRDTQFAGPVGLPSREGGLRLPSAFPWNFGRFVRDLASVDNTGVIDMYPVVTVRGSADSVRVFGGPRRVEFGAFDGELVIDNLSRRVWLNGSDVTRHLTRRDWHVAPAGATTDFWFDAVGATDDMTLTVAYRIGAW